ncbi:taste receptor type 1 member 3 isoform X2 [Cavia porcellus]|uniref:Taste receptor type 1 member 3 n=1 Tax=Cavia porcellus TaxID=10141 RepID=A0A286XYL2_CAVPO
MPAVAVLGLSLVALLGLGKGALLCLSRQFRMQGDYVLGGLFPLGSAEETELNHRTRPDSIMCPRYGGDIRGKGGEEAVCPWVCVPRPGVRCQPPMILCGFRLSATGLFLVMALKMAVEEINNSSTLLPGLKLGYDLFDTCSEPVVTMKPSLMFLAKVDSRSIAAYCNYTQYQPRVLAVIGPHSSELARITGKFFGFFLMPQVSYGASMDKLSNRETFPSFFRTVPSNRVQLEAIVTLLHHFSWNWVAALGSDDEYGREGLSTFSNLAHARNICVAHESLVLLPRTDSPWLGKVQDVLHQVNQSEVHVVVLFASEKAVYSLFQYSIRHSLTPKVWVGSDAWLMSNLVMTLPGIHQVGTILGFLQQGALLPEFSSYMETQLSLAADPAFCASLGAEQDLEEDVVGPRCPQCDQITLQNLSAGLVHNLSAGQLHYQIFATYAAVYSVAQALHHTLRCSTSSCPAQEPVRPWQLLDNMYNMSFRVRGLELQFNDTGNVAMEYELKMWVWQRLTPKLHTVGTFNGSLHLQNAHMNWHTPDNQVPVSQCSQECREGQVRQVKGFHSCCYDCVDCKAGSYRQNPDDLTCTLCNQDQWSPERSTRCFPRMPRFLEWSDPPVLLLLLLLGLVLGLVLAALGLFIYHRDSPLVQASGGPLACFGLACLGPVCLSILLFPGWPGTARCLAQQPMAHLPLTGCLSTLFLQAAETFVESELPPAWVAWVHSHVRGPRAWLLVLLLVLVEATLCSWSLTAFPPKVVMDWQVLPREVLVHCHMHSWVGLGLMHVTNITLAFLCFLGTFLVQSQPGHYNRARSLTFAMLAYFVTWVSFVPLYTNMQMLYQPAVQMGAILLCALGILAIFHLPKCYLLLWWPELNTPEFFLGQGPSDTTDGSGSGGRDRAQGEPE